MKKGDKVMVLDDTHSGYITDMVSGKVRVRFDDGFELDYNPSELLVIDDSEGLISNSSQAPLKDADRPKRKKIKPKKKEIPAFEVDLHIHQLLPSTKGMTKHDILTYQLETARKQLEFAIRKRIPKMVFVHGVGEGVLKTELDFLLGRYDNISFFEASYKDYGFGATEVRIHQNAKRS